MKKIEITKIINESIQSNNFSGVISIKKRGELIYEGASGFADRSNKLKNNMETKFGIASGTKFFTALAIGILIDEGKLSFSTKALDIIKYNFPLYSKVMTIKQLLTHTSGIPDYYDEEKIEDFDNFTLDIPWYELRRPKDYFPEFPKEEMKFSPGERFSYSNGGYVLLAAIIEEVSGMTYKEFVEEKLFKPVGMNNSGYFAMNQLPENTAFGYVDEENGWRTNIYNLPIIGGGDGGAFTTVGDLHKLWEAFLGYKILSEDMVNTYLEPYVNEGENEYYGHGIWVHKEEHKAPKEYILGCDAGVSFKSGIDREKDLVITVISNTTEGAWSILKAIRGLEIE